MVKITQEKEINIISAPEDIGKELETIFNDYKHSDGWEFDKPKIKRLTSGDLSMNLVIRQYPLEDTENLIRREFFVNKVDASVKNADEMIKSHLRKLFDESYEISFDYLGVDDDYITLLTTITKIPKLQKKVSVK